MQETDDTIETDRPREPALGGSGSFEAARRFGRYEILFELGSGGMATLYLAMLRGPERFRKLFVVKKIHEHHGSDQRFVKMFLDEARISSCISHSNVGAVFDMGYADGAYYLAMEYIHGHNCAEILDAAARRPNRFTWQHAVRIVADAACGLHAAHMCVDPDGTPLGIVHRDVSPQNIVVGYDGQVKVVDFGIAYAAERLTRTTSGSIKGKASYISPEQLAGNKADIRSDIFSLGIVLFEASCLIPLFRRTNEADTMLQVQTADIPRPRSIKPELPEELEMIILKALSRDPADRFPNASAMEQALERLLHSSADSVTRAQIGDLMTSLFSDKKRTRERRIRQALEGTGVRVFEPSDSQEEGNLASTVPMRPKKDASSSAPSDVPGRWIAAGAVVLLLSVLVVAYFLVPRTRETKKARTSPAGPAIATADDRQSPAEPRQVSLVLRIIPADASAMVTFRGSNYLGSSFRIKVALSSSPEEVMIRAKGYRTRRLVLIPTGDIAKDVTLEALPRPSSGGSRPQQARRAGSRKKEQAVRKRASDLVKDLP